MDGNTKLLNVPSIRLGRHNILQYEDGSFKCDKCHHTSMTIKEFTEWICMDLRQLQSTKDVL